MKKYLLLLILLIPFSVFAYDIKLDDYNKKDLNQILTDVENDKFINNEENEKGIPIYVFYGKECNYSKSFINFYIDKVLPLYHDKIHIIGFETWHDSKNQSLLLGVLEYKKTDYNGSPYIIIGNETFEGYTSSYDNQILNAIKNYDNKDIFEDMNNIQDRDLNNNIKLILLIVLFVSLIIVVLIFNKKKVNY